MVAFRHAGECVPLSGAVWVKATVGEQEVAALDSAVRPRSAVASTMANSAKFMMRRLTAKPWFEHRFATEHAHCVRLPRNCATGKPPLADGSA